MAIRVIRLMEYIYPDIEAAHKDMRRWQVQGSFIPRKDTVITSTVILEPTSFEMVLIREAPADKFPFLEESDEPKQP